VGQFGHAYLPSHISFPAHFEPTPYCLTGPGGAVGHGPAAAAGRLHAVRGLGAGRPLRLPQPPQVRRWGGLGLCIGCFVTFASQAILPPPSRLKQVLPGAT